MLRKPGVALESVNQCYLRESRAAGGEWAGFVSRLDGDGVTTMVDDRSSEPVRAMSVNKVAVAVAVMTLVDRGELRLAQQLEVSAESIIADGDGLLRLDGAYPSVITVGHLLTLLLTVSDDTAARLCGQLITTDQINTIIASLGYPGTQVAPGSSPSRFFMGATTPRETHDLFLALATGKLLSPPSTTFLLRLLRSPDAFNEGIRRELSSDERARVATKAGWLGRSRHEAGVIFAVDDTPALVYALFSTAEQSSSDFTAQHPAVRARSRMGEAFMDLIDPRQTTGLTIAQHPPGGKVRT